MLLFKRAVNTLPIATRYWPGRRSRDDVVCFGDGVRLIPDAATTGATVALSERVRAVVAGFAVWRRRNLAVPWGSRAALETRDTVTTYMIVWSTSRIRMPEAGQTADPHA